MGRRGQVAGVLLLVMGLSACRPALTGARPPAATPRVAMATRPPPDVQTGAVTTAPSTAGTPPSPPSAEPAAVTSPTSPPLENTATPPRATPTPQSPPSTAPRQIGLSAGGRPLWAYQVGQGDENVVIVGGMHGGYEWNSILLAEQIMAYFREEATALPGALTLHVVPNANPDGLFAVTGFDGSFGPADIAADSTPGRFNGQGVDLNRNWDCNWSPTGLWRNIEVPAGTQPFSEPETAGLRDYFLALEPLVVIFLHSAANGIYVSGCPEPHQSSRELALVYGQAADYQVYTVFDHYLITGDAGDWLTTQGIASFTVELVSHEALEWDKNLTGLLALLAHLSAAPAGPERLPAVGHRYE